MSTKSVRDAYLFIIIIIIIIVVTISGHCYFLGFCASCRVSVDA